MGVVLGVAFIPWNAHGISPRFFGRILSTTSIDRASDDPDTSMSKPSQDDPPPPYEEAIAPSDNNATNDPVATEQESASISVAIHRSSVAPLDSPNREHADARTADGGDIAVPDSATITPTTTLFEFRKHIERRYVGISLDAVVAVFVDKVYLCCESEGEVRKLDERNWREARALMLEKPDDIELTVYLQRPLDRTVFADTYLCRPDRWLESKRPEKEGWACRVQ